ncbi:MAG: hypothetical protein NZ518_00100 [Dehalococcoidia bacterium]|nr:hypothetical protein [Dehalococcoidia bacterium]
MAYPVCSDVTVSPAISFVSSGYGTFLPLATSQVATSNAYLQNLASLQIQPITASVSFSWQPNPSIFAAPQPPARPTISSSISAPNIAVPQFSETYQGTTAPTENVPRPLLAIPSAPSYVEQPLPARPTITLPTPPSEPSLTLPDLPQLSQITLPTPPTITIPPFTAVAPVIDFTAPIESWSFSPTEYVSTLEAAIKAKLHAIFAGGTGISAAIEQAIFARGAQRAYMEEQRQVAEAWDLFAARGFDSPPGTLVARIENAREIGAMARAEINRDTLIRVHESEIEQLRFAIQQAIQYDQVLGNLHYVFEDLLFKAAQFARDTAIQIFNSKVALFNAKVALFEAQARVYREQIQAEIAKVEIYKAQIEGAIAQARLNDALVQTYVAQVQAVQTMVEMYRSRVAAFTAQIEGERAKLELYRAELAAIVDRGRIFEAQVAAYRARIDAERAKVEIYDADVRAYATRVTAWGEAERARVEAFRTRLAAYQSQLEAIKTQLEVARTGIEADRAKAQALASLYDADAQIYAASGQIAQAQSAAYDRTQEVAMRAEQTRVEVASQDAERALRQHIALTQLQVEVARAVAQISSQLASAITSAVNFGASVNLSDSRSRDCNVNLNAELES